MRVERVAHHEGDVLEVSGMRKFPLRVCWSVRLALVAVITGFLFLELASLPLQAQTVTATVATGTDPDAVAVNPVTNKIYVANIVTNNVTVIDGATNTVSTVNVGLSPRAVAVNPVTNRIYVANGDGGSSVTVIDGATNVTATVNVNNIDAPDLPVAVAVNPVTNKIYVAARSANGLQHGTIIVIDGATNSTTLINMRGQVPEGIAINPVTNKIYVAALDSGGGPRVGVVNVIDGATNTNSIVGIGNSLSGVAVNPNTNTIYVTDQTNSKLWVIDGTNNATTAVSVGTSPVAPAVNTQTNKIYITNFGGNSVTVIDGMTNATTTVPTGSNPLAAAVDETTNKIYVPNRVSNTVTVIDGSNNTTSTVNVGSGPTTVGVNPTTNSIYVVNSGGNTVSVIDGPTSFPNPDFILNASPFNLSLQPGNSGTSSISISALGGFNSDIHLSFSGVPPGVTAVLDPTSFSAPGSGTATLSFSASSTASNGTFTIPVTASGGGISHSLTIVLNIATSGFSVSASPTSVAVTQGGSTSTTVTTTVFDSSLSGDMSLSASGLPAGVTATFNPSKIPNPGNGSSSLTFTASSTAGAGTKNVTITATGRFGETRTTTLPLTVVPGADFVLTSASNSLSISRSISNSTTITTTAANSFNSDVSLSASGLPQGVTANFSPSTIPAPGSGNSTLTFTADSTTPIGTTSVTITASGGGMTHTVTVSLTVTAGSTTVVTGTNPSAVGLNPVTNKIYVTNSGSNTVTVIDGATNTASTVNVGKSPSAVAVNSVTNKIYVGNHTDSSVTVIDGATNATFTISMTTADEPVDPVALVVNPMTSKVYVASSSFNGLQHAEWAVIDGATNATTMTTLGGQFAGAAAVNPVTNTIYLTSMDGNPGGVFGAVTVIDGATNASSAASVGNNLTAMAVNPTTNKIYVTDPDNGKVQVLGGTAVNDSFGPDALAINTQTNKIYVANSGGNNVTVIDGSNNTTTTVAVGSNPVAVAVDETTNKIYVANHDSNNVTIIDGSNNTTTTVDVGIGPDAIGVNPVTNAIYVANAGSNTVSVIDAPASPLNPDFTLDVSPANPLIHPGSSGTSTISISAMGGFSSDISLSFSGLPAGVTAVLSSTSLPAPGSGTSTLTFSASSTAENGTYAIAVTASGGGVSHTITIFLTIATQDMSVSVSPTSVSLIQGGSGQTTATVTIFDNNNLDSDISLSVSDLPAGVTATFNPSRIPFPGNGSSTLTFTANPSAVSGTTNVTVTAQGRFGISSSTTVALTVNPAADFTVSASPASLTVVKGNANHTTVATTAGGLFSSDISLSVSTLPQGITASFSQTTIPAPGSGSATLTFTADSTAPTGTTNLAVIASGGGKTHTVPVSLTVTAGSTLVYTFPTATVVGSVRVVTQGRPNLDYTAGAGTTCTAQSYNAGDSCTVVVSFVPNAAGLRMGAVQIVDNSGNLVFQTLLSNIGQGAQLAMVPGAIITVAGNGTPGFSGEHVRATTAELNEPFGVAVDAASNIYVADLLNHRIRQVNTFGQIFTIAGDGTADYSGDGGPATHAQLNQPLGIAVDGAGNLYIADADNNVIRRIDALTGIITTVAGNGTAGDSGDDGPATGAQLFFPFRVAVDGAANLFIADNNNRIRKVDASTGIITTVAGNGTAGFSGDNGPATAAQLNGPRGVTLDAAGNLYIAEYFNSRIRKVDAVTGIITTVAGDGHLPGDGTVPAGDGPGDGGPAISAHLHNPSAVAVDAAGNLYIADSGTHVIRKVDAASGIINRLAGALDLGQGLDFNGDGEVATAANLHDPDDLALDSAGDLYTPDALQQRVRMVLVAAPRITFSGAQSGTYVLTISNTGNQPLIFSGFKIDAPFGIDSNVTSCSVATSLLPGSTCAIGVFFAPLTSGSFSGYLTLSDNALNTTSQLVALSGSTQ